MNSRLHSRRTYFTNRKGAETEAVWMMDPDGSNPVKLIQDSYVNAFPRWTSDGQSLVFASRRRGVDASRIVRKLSLSGTVPEELPVQLIEAGGVDVSPDGRLVFRERGARFQVYDPASKKAETLASTCIPGGGALSRRPSAFKNLISA